MQSRAARKYFAYMGKHFPVMCTSGAFQSVPPVAEAAKHLDRLDDLSRRGITKHAARITKFKRDFENAEAKASTQEERAIARALAMSASGVVAELGQLRSWERLPELYLLVAFTGLDQAVDLPAPKERVREKRFLKRLKAVPGLLTRAQENIEAVSPASRGVAQTMIRDCARYLTELGDSDLGKVGKAPKFLAECLSALRDFDRFVGTRTEIPETEGPAFSLMAEEILGTNKSAQEIYAIAETEYNQCLATLREMEKEFGKSWKTVLEEYSGPADAEDMEATDVLIREIHRLRGFIFENAFQGLFQDTGLRVEAQPLHLASTLRPVHYDPALGAWEDQPSHCSVSPQLFTGRGFRDDPARLAQTRREYIFFAARQTYPGRHLLDSQRRALGDSPMAQLTNPLFTAGWLAFAEELLNELGYLTDPRDRLVFQKRSLVRAALAMIDAGLAVGNLDQDKCLSILSSAGLSEKQALNRVRSIRLAPTSKVMPVLGLHEIKQLREASDLPLPQFCQRLLSKGQVPLSYLSDLM